MTVPLITPTLSSSRRAPPLALHIFAGLRRRSRGGEPRLARPPGRPATKETPAAAAAPRPGEQGPLGGPVH